MTRITYEFEELAPFKGMCVLVSGKAEITGTCQSAEPDVGIMNAYYEYDVDSIYIDGYEKGDPDSTQITKEHVLYQPIMDALYSEYYESRICDELSERDAPDPDYYRD